MMQAQDWRADLEQWALGYCVRLAASAGRDGVLMGGSIARGEQWEHSDLEVGYLRGPQSPPLDYFATDSGRGVERIGLIGDDLDRDLAAIDSGDVRPIVNWPIQLYRGRVIHDPTGVLARFTSAFDELLFTPQVTHAKIDAHLADYRIHHSRALQAQRDGRPRVALTWLRHAMNDLILVQYWSCGELPRSQNRTDSRLRDLADRHGLHDFYRLYRDVYRLDGTQPVITEDWPVVRDRVLGIAASWLAGAGDFFEQAVDSTFSWGEDGGILGAYRLYIPTIGDDDGLFATLDDADWIAGNAELVRFLGLNDPHDLSTLIERVEAAAAGLHRV
jgi:hypothetical protein